MEETTKGPWAPASTAVVFHYFPYAFLFFCVSLLIFSFRFSFLRLSLSRALQGAGFMSWWGFGFCAGQFDSEKFYIAYTAIHDDSATPARQTPHDASSALPIL